MGYDKVKLFSWLYHKLFVDSKNSQGIPPPSPPDDEESQGQVTDYRERQPDPMPVPSFEPSAQPSQAESSAPDPAEPRTRPAPRSIQKLVESLPEHAEWNPPAPFHLCDGRTLRGPKDLLSACDSMSQDTFYHHVREDANDFADWLKDVYEDPRAQAVRNAGSIEELRSALGGALKQPLQAEQSPTEPAPQQPPAESRARRKLPVTGKAPEQSPQVVALTEQVESLRSQLEALRADLSEEIASGFRAMKESRVQTAAQPVPITAKPRDDSLKEHLLALVHSARGQLSRGELEEARRTYSSARDQFYQAPIGEEEKQILYNLIHELYTDIELASLE